jgi:hypothetical protein
MTPSLGLLFAAGVVGKKRGHAVGIDLADKLSDRVVSEGEGDRGASGAWIHCDGDTPAVTAVVLVSMAITCPMGLRFIARCPAVYAGIDNTNSARLILLLAACQISSAK